MKAIPGLELVEMKESSLCCGSAGIYNIIREEMANELGDRKALHAMETPATEVITANPGCQMQVRASLRRNGSRQESATSPICSTRRTAEQRRSARSSADRPLADSELFQPIDIVPDHGEARAPESAITQVDVESRGQTAAEALPVEARRSS